MAKYSFELKKKIVLEYLNGHIGSTTLAKKYDIKSEKQVRQWIKSYKQFGDDGLLRSRKNEYYTFEFKLHMVELYLSNEVSYEDLALANGISNYTMLSRWVNDFRIAGPDGLRPKQKGRKSTLDKPDKNSIVDTSAKHVKELEDELLKLRIENAYLKELRRLRLEEEALLKEKRELSTASEENSN
jgi:transposase